MRVYYYNKGNMLELIRYQREEKQAVGAEKPAFSSSDIIKMERENKKRLGDFADMKTYTIPHPHFRKMANFNNYIRGL